MRRQIDAHSIVHPYVRSRLPSLRPDLLSLSQGGGWRSIGIGGRLTTPPLPHHRAYGSVPRRFGGLSTRGCRAFGFGHRRGHFDLSHGRTRGFTPARYRQVQRKLEWRSHCGHETSELLALSFNPSSGTVRAFGRRSSLLCPLLARAGEFATEGRSKSPPEAGRNRHPVAGGPEPWAR